MARPSHRAAIGPGPRSRRRALRHDAPARRRSLSPRDPAPLVVIEARFLLPSRTSGRASDAQPVCWDGRAARAPPRLPLIAAPAGSGRAPLDLACSGLPRRYRSRFRAPQRPSPETRQRQVRRGARRERPRRVSGGARTAPTARSTSSQRVLLITRPPVVAAAQYSARTAWRGRTNPGFGPRAALGRLASGSGPQARAAAVILGTDARRCSCGSKARAPAAMSVGGIRLGRSSFHLSRRSSSSSSSSSSSQAQG